MDMCYTRVTRITKWCFEYALKHNTIFLFGKKWGSHPCFLEIVMPTKIIFYDYFFFSEKVELFNICNSGRF